MRVAGNEPPVDFGVALVASERTQLVFELATP